MNAPEYLDDFDGMVVWPSALFDAAVHSAELSQQYEAAKHAIELLAKDEDDRRAHAELLISKYDVSELHEQLRHEQSCSEHFRSIVNEHLIRAQDAETTLEAIRHETKRQQSEVVRLQVELDSLRATSHDTNQLLVDKLGLERELSVLRPELQHLRTQAASVEQLVTEKYALQRELNDAQCDVASARAETKRAHAKRRNTSTEIAQEVQLEDLKRQLAREQRARETAEALAKTTQIQPDVNELRNELAKEKQLRKELNDKFEASTRKGEAGVQERQHKALVTRSAERAQPPSEQTEDAQRSDVAKPVSPEPAEHAAASIPPKLTPLHAKHTEVERHAVARESQRTAEWTSLNDKQSQLRTKLREKEKIPPRFTSEESEAKTGRAGVIESDRIPAMTGAITSQAPSSKTLRKRAAQAMDPTIDETSLGTPGDGPQLAKRCRTANAAIGSKSAFSITPFLNKTTVLDAGDKTPASEIEPSPTKSRRRKPLANAESGVRNSTPKFTHPKDGADGQKHDHVKSLPEAVENVKLPLQNRTDKRSEEDDGKSIAKQKPRKSLVNFKTFQKVDDQPVIKQKKRKLGGPGPTLFDDDEDITQGTTMKTSFANRSLTRAALGNRLASSKKDSLAGRNGLLSANDGSGFQFSPLRRNRSNIDNTLRA